MTVDEEKKLDEKALESVAGGEYTPPTFDRNIPVFTCPACGETIKGDDFSGLKVQCPGCGHWLRRGSSGLMLMEG